MGLMSVGLRSGPNGVDNVYASLGAGDCVSVGDVSVGRLQSALRNAGKKVGVVADSSYSSKPSSLLRMFPLPDRPPFLIGSPSPPPPGVLPFVDVFFRADPAELTKEVNSDIDRCDLVVVHFSDLADISPQGPTGLAKIPALQRRRSEAIRRLSTTVRLVSASLSRFPRARLYIVAATPPASWDRLCPVVQEDVGAEVHGGLLTSTTTHTPGLIASRDLAPSILDYLQVPIPIQMTGAPIESRPMASADIDRTLDHLDRVTYLDQRAQNPFFWGIGVLGGLVIFACVGLTIRGKPVGNPVVLYLLRVLSSWPLALLLVWVFDPHTMAAYLGWIGAVCLVVALLPSPAVILWVTSLVVVIDAFFGSRLVAQTVLSAYWMSGIRFYGIGNEYMGFLIGGALLTPVVFGPFSKTPPARSTTINVIAEPASPNRPSRAEGISTSFALIGLYLALTVFVLSFPAFGAKAGGAVTATGTFLFLWWELRGRKITPLMSIEAVAIGFGLVIVWAVLGHVLHLTPTHIDTAVGAASSGRFGYILGVAERKVGLALKVAVHPGTIAGVVALVALVAGTRTLMRDRLQSLWDRRPDYRAVVTAGIRGCVVALLFNDSGIVAAILLTISLMLPVLYDIFEQS